MASHVRMQAMHTAKTSPAASRPGQREAWASDRPGQHVRPAANGSRRTVSEERRWVEAFVERGDELAFRSLYRRHTPFLYAMAHRLTGGSADSTDDLVEETWVRAARRLAGFRWRSELRTWLAGILVNCRREAARARSSRPTVALGDRPIPSREAPPGLAMELEEALARLPEGYREVFVLYHVYGYKHREIAELLGITTGTSKSQLARGLARLRELLR